MARSVLNVQIKLDRIVCFDEGDGPGDAEPYLWTVFFKIDGTTSQLNAGGQLVGTATTHFTPGSHGNLGTTDVDAGDTVNIPDAIGLWNTTLVPIPVAAPLNSLIADVPGVIGVACVLMEEDNVSDDGAEAGHQALNTGIQNSLNQIITTLSASHQGITDADIENFTNAVQGTVEAAVQNEQNIFENLWSAIDKDDNIGKVVLRFEHDKLVKTPNKSFSNRWTNEGDWEIFGHIAAVSVKDTKDNKDTKDTKDKDKDHKDHKDKDGQKDHKEKEGHKDLKDNEKEKEHDGPGGHSPVAAGSGGLAGQAPPLGGGSGRTFIRPEERPDVGGSLYRPAESGQ